MSDLGISSNPAPGEDKPEVDTTTTDWEKQYNELRPEYTRTTQSLAEAQERISDYDAFMDALSDPETQAQALASLGIQVDTGSQDDDDEFVDPLEREVNELREVVQELRSARELDTNEREQEQLDDLRDQFIGESIGAIEDSLKSQFGADFKFSEKEDELLGNLAIAMEDENGVPDVRGAFESVYGNSGVLEINRQRWLDGKETANIPPAGRTIPADERPTTAKDRIAYFDQRVAALENARQ